MTRLGDPWLVAPRTQAVCALLTEAGHAAYLVGGCVRNALLGAPVADIDLATDALPQAVLALAEAAGVKAVPTGIEHGTVTLVLEGQPFEVTTFRRDVETFGRHAVVAFSRDIAEDAARRDFTMNALYAKPDGALVDPLGGLPDLRAGRVRFVGAAEARIAEDYLRILRFFRFHAWYGHPEDGLDPEGLAACAAARDGLAQLSRERVGAEMARLLAAPDPAPALTAMAATGILGVVLPGADPAAIAPLVAAERALGAAPRWQRRLAALGGGEDWAERLRLSKADARALAASLAALDEVGAAPAQAAYRHGAEAARDAALVCAARARAAPAAGLEREINCGAAAVFPLRAADLALGGPALGAELRRLEALWIDSGFRLDAEDLRRMAEAPEGGG
ncbi:MAG: CCA tRNA nucleotidyltransferase [Rhodobacteraceae bacterium]|nr:CCA tRNA nucleotidyltransferase [Paracoccaceae bacterium]